MTYRIKHHVSGGLASLAVGLLLAASPVAAQDASDTDSQTFDVIGNVPILCSAGTLTGDGIYDLGVLIDTSTGFLRTDLSAPDKVLSGAFCSARSSISISATRIEAQNFTGAAPTGFSKQIDYTATASGWTDTPASFDTGATTNAADTQLRDSAFTGDITVGISNFSTTGGATLRPVADTSYLGQIVVTLSAAE